VLVWVASYPRSGNSLFRLTIRDAFGIGEVGNIHRNDLALGYLGDKVGTGERAYAPRPELVGLDRHDLLGAIRERPEPFFIKTHRLRDALDPAPAAYIVRDGRDALVSHAHFVENGPTRFRDQPFDRRLEMLIEPGVRAYGHWSCNVERWRERVAPTTILRFEDLVRDPVAVVSGACGDLGIALPATRGLPPGFADLHSANPRMFRKGQIGAWRNEMAPRLEQRFWRVHGAEMEACGYSRR
jgi:hypothetical protein